MIFDHQFWGWLFYFKALLNILRNTHYYDQGYNPYADELQTERERRILDKLRKTEDEINELKYKNKVNSQSFHFWGFVNI